MAGPLAVYIVGIGIAIAARASSADWPVDRLAAARAARVRTEEDGHGRDRRRPEPQDAREREAPVRGAVRLRAGDEHLPARSRWSSSRWWPLGLVGLNFHTVVAVLRRSSRSSSGSTRSAGPRRCSTTRPRYQPQPPELRYFLTQFVVKHFSRIRATVQREYPDSLLFLEPALADATIAQNEQSRVHRDVPDEPLRRRDRRRRPERQPERAGEPPFKASVSFQKVCYTPARATSATAQTYVAQVDFVLRDHVPNEFVRVNPLGLQITYFRVDQAFEEGQPMIANVAFLAALTMFLAVAWLAGELSFLAPFKAGLFRQHGVTIGVGDPAAVPEPVRRVLQLARWLFLRDTGRKLRTWTGNSGRDDAVLERPPARTSKP